MNKSIHTVELPVLEMPRAEVGILAKRILNADLEKEQPKKKVRQDVMLAACEGHEHQHELEQMIKHEFQCDMIEISSGNGRYATEWNPDGLPMAQGTDSNSHDECGLAEHIETSSNGSSINTQETDIYNYDMVTDGNGHQYRVDDLSSVVTVDTNQYSIWQTIEQKGMLIVRKTGHWQKGTFDAIGYKAREARRLITKHRKLLGLNLICDNKQVSNYKAREAKRLAKLAQRRGSINKVGYNAF